MNNRDGSFLFSREKKEEPSFYIRMYNIHIREIMRKRVLLVFALIWLFVSLCIPVSGAEEKLLVLPAVSLERSDDLALDLLDLGSAVDAQGFSKLCEDAGFEVLLQKHFEKSKQDPAHNCAFTISEGEVLRGDAMCPALLVTIRGTLDGEWYSNFDFCPSHRETPDFAENFLFCAEDVFLSLKEYLDVKDPSEPVIITGISRGAACSNLLGLLVNDYLSSEDQVQNVYVYTFACSNVIGKHLNVSNSENIFNYINPADLIPKVPLSQWGFRRAGTDIVLPQEDEVLIEAAEKYTRTILDIAPSITDYYTVRHSLTQPGEDPLGLTSFELMMLLSSQIIRESDKVIYEDGNLIWQGSGQSSSNMLDSFRESDFAEMINAFDPLFQEHNGKMMELLLQHLPLTYRPLIQKLITP